MEAKASGAWEPIDPITVKDGDREVVVLVERHSGDGLLAGYSDEDKGLYVVARSLSLLASRASVALAGLREARAELASSL